MDIWAVPWKGKVFVQFLTEPAIAWAVHSNYCMDYSEPVLMNRDEYEMLKADVVDCQLFLFEDTGKES